MYYHFKSIYKFVFNKLRVNFLELLTILNLTPKQGFYTPTDNIKYFMNKILADLSWFCRNLS